MSTKLTMTVSKTVTTEFQIDLEEWFTWQEMTEKERFTEIQGCIDSPCKLLDDGGINIINELEEVELVYWDIK